MLLRDRGRELGADIQFCTELTWFEQDGTRITAVLTDRRTRAEQALRADHLVAADGHASPTS